MECNNNSNDLLKTIEEACNMEYVNAIEYIEVCQMMSIKVSKYKSLHGIIYVMSEKMENTNRVTSIIVGDKLYRDIKTVVPNREFAEVTNRNARVYLLDSCNETLLIIGEHGFIIDEHMLKDLDKLANILKELSNNDISLEDIKCYFDSNKIQYIGTTYYNNNIIAIVLFHGRICLVKNIPKMSSHEAILVLDIDKVYYVYKDEVYSIEIDSDFVDYITKNSFALSKPVYFTDKIFSMGHLLVDTQLKKAYVTGLGFWETVKNCDRYIQCRFTDYIGVICESVCAIYDTLESVMYLVKDSSKEFIDNNGNVLNIDEVMSKELGVSFDIVKYNYETDYSYKKTIKDELLAEIEGIKIK